MEQNKMKKTIKIAFVAAFIASIGWNYYSSQRDVPLPDLALNNIEALASYEIDNECNGCIMNCIYICKDFEWGGCIGDPYAHYA